MTDWQPIKTAPQETAVLLWYPWKGQARQYAPLGFIYIGRWTSTGNDDNDEWRDPVDYEPLGEGATHWMALPEPPAKQDQ